MSTKENGSDTTTEIRGDIERARADMARTVGQIEARLSPAHLKGHMANISDAFVSQYHDVKDHVKADLKGELSEAKQVVHEELREAKAAVSEEIQNVKTVAYDATVGKVKNMAHDASETVRDAGTSVLDTIKRNPIPAVLVAVGVGWLFMDARRPGPRRLATGVEDDGWQVREKVGNLAQRTGDRLGGFAGDVRDGAMEVVHDARDATAHAADGAREVAHKVAQGTRDVAKHAGDMGRTAVRGFDHALDVNPLAVGAVAVAVGAAVGLALPHTNREDAWMGEAKDRLVSRAKGMAQGVATDAMRQVEDAANGAIHHAETKLGEKVDMLGVQGAASDTNRRLGAGSPPDRALPT